MDNPEDKKYRVELSPMGDKPKGELVVYRTKTMGCDFALPVVEGFNPHAIIGLTFEDGLWGWTQWTDYKAKECLGLEMIKQNCDFDRWYDCQFFV